MSAAQLRPFGPPPQRPACAGMNPELFVGGGEDEDALDAPKSAERRERVDLLKATCASCPLATQDWCLEEGIRLADRMTYRAGFALWRSSDATAARRKARQLADARLQPDRKSA